MSEWNPQIVRIEQLRPHPDADSLDIAVVLGDYPVIVKRGEYQVGDLAGYIPIDTVTPDTEQFYFLCPKAYEKYEDEQGNLQQRQLGPKYPVGQVPEKYRVIKAKRIRGTFSMGMLVSVPYMDKDGLCAFPFSYCVGESIVDVLQLKKVEEQEEENIPCAKMRGINTESPPKGFTVPHYDIDGIRKYVNCLQEGEEIVLTEKLHGSNAAFVHDGERLWTKSRNWFKRRDKDDMWWDIAFRYDLEDKLSQFPHLVFFGEVYGQVKGFRYDTKIEGGRLLPRVRFFDIWDTKQLRYLDFDDFVAIIQSTKLDAVPLLYRGAWTGKEALYPYAEGLTTLGGKHVREGFVLRTAKERYEPRLDSRMCVKLVGEGYSLQK